MTHSRNTPWTITLASVVCIAAALTVSVMSPATAAIPTRVTAGEANAVFQSQWVGGVAIGTNLLSLSSPEDLAASGVHIWLDGAPIDLVTTAIKPFPHFDLYGRGYGLVAPPGTPAAGRHNLTATIDFLNGASLDFGTTVSVGSADSPACTGS